MHTNLFEKNIHGIDDRIQNTDYEEIYPQLEAAHKDLQRISQISELTEAKLKSARNQIDGISLFFKAVRRFYLDFPSRSVNAALRFTPAEKESFTTKLDKCFETWNSVNNWYKEVEEKFNNKAESILPPQTGFTSAQPLSPTEEKKSTTDSKLTINSVQQATQAYMTLKGQIDQMGLARTLTDKERLQLLNDQLKKLTTSFLIFLDSCPTPNKEALGNLISRASTKSQNIDRHLTTGFFSDSASAGSSVSSTQSSSASSSSSTTTTTATSLRFMGMSDSKQTITSIDQADDAYESIKKQMDLILADISNSDTTERIKSLNIQLIELKKSFSIFLVSCPNLFKGKLERYIKNIDKCLLRLEFFRDSLNSSSSSSSTESGSASSSSSTTTSSPAMRRFG